MNSNNEDLDQRVFRLNKRVQRLEHDRRPRYHHPHGNFVKDDFAWNGCVWLFVFLFIIGIFLTFILVPVYWPYHSHPHPLPPPPAAEKLPGPQYVKSAKRGRGMCTVGEYYDSTIQMCAPQIHLPMAYDATIMDTQSQVCHSFYNNSCGKWNAQHAGTGEHRTFSFAHHKNQALLKQIILNRSNTALNDFYQSCLTKNAHESGIELKHVVNVVTENLRSHADLPTALGRLARYAYTGPFVLSIERNPIEARLMPMIAFDNLQIDEQLIYSMLNQARGLLNYNVLDLQQRVQAIVKVIRYLNEHCPEAERMEGITNYTDYVTNKFARNVVKFNTLKEWNLKGMHAPVDGWYQYFHALDGHGLKFSHDQDVWVIGLPYVQWLLREGFNTFELFEWKAYLEFSILYHSHQFEPELPQNVYRGPPRRGGRLKRRGNEAAGQLSRTAVPQQASLQEACFGTAQHMLPGLVARSFLDLIPADEYLSMKNRVTKLVLNIRQTLIDTVNQTTWLTLQDKQIIIGKLSAILVRVAEPDEWTQEPFAGQIAPDRYDHNMNLIRKYRVERNMQLWSATDTATLHRSAYATFAMPLQAVNAYYAPSSNTITILAGILQLPFFSVQFNQVSEYAILGSIIGHELSHALDANGLFWDHEGSFKPAGIISAASMNAFRNRTACLINEYQEAQQSCAHYGEQTLSENIADVTGIGLAYKALSPRSMSDQQYFFFVLSQAFCEAAPSLDGASSTCSSDPHAEAKFRIDLVFRNMPEFAQVFNCAVGQRMYKQDKCKIY